MTSQQIQQIYKMCAKVLPPKPRCTQKPEEHPKEIGEWQRYKVWRLRWQIWRS